MGAHREQIEETMKKLVLACVCACLVLGARAQESEKKFTDGIRWAGSFGMNVAKFSSSAMSSRVGFHLGVRAEKDLPALSKGIYASAAALLSLKGSKIDGGELMDVKYNPWFLEIPVHIGYKFEVSEKFTVFGKFGPYFALGLFGKAKADVLDWDEDSFDTVTKTEKFNIFGDGGLKRFDFGLGLHAGVEFEKKWQLSIGYDFGLMKAYKDNSEDIDLADGLKHRNLSISLSHFF